MSEAAANSKDKNEIEVSKTILPENSDTITPLNGSHLQIKSPSFNLAPFFSKKGLN